MESLTREESLLNSIAEGEGTELTPATREEIYLAAIANGDKEGLPQPVTRKEVLLNTIAQNGGGGSATLIEKSITENGTYSAADDEADGYSQVTVEVSGGGSYTPESNVPLNIADVVTIEEVS